MQFFPNIARNSFGAEIWRVGKGGGTWGKKREKKKNTQPIAQSLFLKKLRPWGGQDMWLPPPAPGAPELQSRPRWGFIPFLCGRAVWEGRMAVCGYVCVHIYRQIYN